MPRPTILRSIKRRRLREAGLDAGEPGQQVPRDGESVHDTAAPKKKRGKRGSKVARALVGFAALLCVLTATPPAQAAGTSAVLRWTLATQYENGTALAVVDIKETLIEWRIKGQTALAGSARVAAPAITTTAQLGSGACGAYDFVAKTVLKDATESDPTAVVPYNTGVTCTPNPPSGVTVT